MSRPTPSRLAVMSLEPALRELELLVRSRCGLIVVDTAEEERAEALLRYLAGQLSLFYVGWTPTKGLRRANDPAPSPETADLAAALAHVDRAPEAAVYHFRGARIDPDSAVLASALRDAIAQLAPRRGALVFSGEGIVLPHAVRSASGVVRLAPPGPREYREMVQRVVRELSAREPVKVELRAEDLPRFLSVMRGLTLAEAERIVTRAIITDGRLHLDDIERVTEAKRQIIEQEGVLEYHEVGEGFGETAGLDGLKAWLAKRRNILAEPERAAQFGLTFPKGVMLVGVPGCGKSLCAKAVAADWRLPLLKLDASNLYDKYVGESERNFRRAMSMAERMAPIVLWIDEIEKAFSADGGGEDGGVSMRILGSFLSWLQERRGDVFVVATANDVTRLPPEFIRKGRFDEVFFVDLPTPAAREAIFAIHLKKRGRDAARFGLSRLSEATDGFSGAEIEQAVVGALYSAFAAGRDLDDAGLLAEVGATRPLSLTMGERFAKLRAWASERTVPAN